MNISLFIYLLSVVDNLRIIIVVFMVIGYVIGLGAILFIGDTTAEEERNKCLKVSLVFIIVAFLNTFLFILIPKSKVIAAMYIVPKIVSSKAGQKMAKLPEKFVDILNAKMTEYLKDFKPKK